MSLRIDILETNNEKCAANIRVLHDAILNIVKGKPVQIDTVQTVLAPATEHADASEHH